MLTNKEECPNCNGPVTMSFNFCHHRDSNRTDRRNIRLEPKNSFNSFGNSGTVSFGNVQGNVFSSFGGSGSFTSYGGNGRTTIINGRVVSGSGSFTSYPDGV